jgi:hypothetical protein
MTTTYCELCGGKLDDRACPLCGEMTEEQLHHVVGGMGVLGGIGVGLTVLRLIQGRLIRRDLAKRN